MSVVFSKLFSFFLATVFALLPAAGSLNMPFQTKTDECLLNLALISDTHIDYRELLLQGMLVSGMKGVSKSKSNVDALVFAGDITNYGDKKSVEKFYELVAKYNDYSSLIVASGNHEIGHNEGFTQDDARNYCIALYNQYASESTEKIYYSVDIKGYKFIVLGDEGDDTWDDPVFSETQLSFLDNELSLGTAENKPCFVICHWPIKGVNGESTVWAKGALTKCNDALTNILNKYQNKNVFFISGHLHQGVKSVYAASLLGFNSIEERNGINYINLPTFGLVNMYGLSYGGIGMMLEVYENEVVVRPRNFITNKWYPHYEVSLPLV